MGEAAKAFLHQDATAASLGLARIVVFGIILVELAVDPIGRLPELPNELFSAPGPLALLPQSFWDFGLTPIFLNSFKAALLILLLLVTIGAVHSRYYVAMTVVGVIFYQGLVRAYLNHMNHAELALIYIAVLLTFYPIFDGLTVRRTTSFEVMTSDNQSQNWTYIAAFLSACVIICLVYLFTASARLWKGTDLFVGPALQALIAKKALLLGHYDGSTLTLSRVRTIALDLPTSIYLFGFAAVTFLELAAPLALFARRFRQVIIPSLLLFHVTAWILMDARFWENMILLGFFSNDWFHRLAAWLDRGWGDKKFFWRKI